MPTVEMDYSAIQPRLLLAEKGVELDGDPYDIGIDDRFRPLVKETFNRLINGKRKPFPTATRVRALYLTKLIWACPGTNSSGLSSVDSNL